jgi:uncharacterized protein YprB with RNaseH-like and TPR domain
MKNNPYFNNLNTAVFDIETTGLTPYRDNLILGGIYSFAENSVLLYMASHQISSNPKSIYHN